MYTIHDWCNDLILKLQNEPKQKKNERPKSLLKSKSFTWFFPILVRQNFVWPKVPKHDSRIHTGYECLCKKNKIKQKKRNSIKFNFVSILVAVNFVFFVLYQTMKNAYHFLVLIITVFLLLLLLIMIETFPIFPLQ